MDLIFLALSVGVLVFWSMFWMWVFKKYEQISKATGIPEGLLMVSSPFWFFGGILLVVLAFK